eukprot:6730815-Prymnesium_polylepis.2
MTWEGTCNQAITQSRNHAITQSRNHAIKRESTWEGTGNQAIKQSSNQEGDGLGGHGATGGR